MRAFTNNLFIFWSLANFLCCYTILDSICFEKFVKTITLHLSKDKNIFLGTFRKIFLMLYFTLRIENSKLCVYEMSVASV